MDKLLKYILLIILGIILYYILLDINTFNIGVPGCFSCCAGRPSGGGGGRGSDSDGSDYSDSDGSCSDGSCSDGSDSDYSGSDMGDVPILRYFFKGEYTNRGSDERTTFDWFFADTSVDDITDKDVLPIGRVRLSVYHLPLNYKQIKVFIPSDDYDMIDGIQNNYNTLNASLQYQPEGSVDRIINLEYEGD
jgi:hypothetical protein